MKKKSKLSNGWLEKRALISPEENEFILKMCQLLDITVADVIRLGLWEFKRNVRIIKENYQTLEFNTAEEALKNICTLSLRNIEEEDNAKR